MHEVHRESNKKTLALGCSYTALRRQLTQLGETGGLQAYLPDGAIFAEDIVHLLTADIEREVAHIEAPV